MIVVKRSIGNVESSKAYTEYHILNQLKLTQNGIFYQLSIYTRDLESI